MRVSRGAPLVLAAAAMLVLAGCSTDEPEAGSTPTGGASAPATTDSEWFV